jgi:hypothetical protein
MTAEDVPKLLSGQEYSSYFRTYNGCKDLLIDLGQQLEKITTDKGSIQESYKLNQKINETIEIAANAQAKLLDHLMVMELQRQEENDRRTSQTQQGNREDDKTASPRQGQV